MSELNNLDTIFVIDVYLNDGISIILCSLPAHLLFVLQLFFPLLFIVLWYPPKFCIDQNLAVDFNMFIFYILCVFLTFINYYLIFIVQTICYFQICLLGLSPHSCASRGFCTNLTDSLAVLIYCR